MKSSQQLQPALPILLVDDEKYILREYELLLQHEGFTNLISCEDGRQALTVLASHNVSLAVLDLHMPEMSGEDLLQVLADSYPDIPSIITTAIDDVETVVRCMKAGAADYIVKPVEPARFLTTIKRFLELQELRRENRLLRESVLDQRLKSPEAFSELITHNPQMLSMFKYIESIAVTSQPVLISGDTGVGKELIARAIHRLSACKGPLVAVNVAGLDDTTFSDTLFGHTRGAFTGADRVRAGLIEQAADGTLFLDEIGDLAPGSQVKLLRLLQEREYYPLGADRPRTSNARILVATNRDLLALQESGSFRADLYYRLLSHHVHVPPLRERRDDIPLLTEFFLQKAADELGKTKPTPPPELFTLLSLYDFPGNIRELQALIFDAVSRHTAGKLSLDSFRKLIGHTPARSEAPEPASTSAFESLFASLDRLPTLKEVEELFVQEALKRSGGNRTISAALLGIDRRTLQRRFQKKNGKS